MQILRQLTSWLSPAGAISERWRNRRLQDTPLLAIDLELTGLDPATAEITSIGWVEGMANAIHLQGCFYRVIATARSLEQSPVIHGLVAEDIAGGERLTTVLKPLIDLADSHVWVLHNTLLDLPVILRGCAQLKYRLPPLLTIDTLRLAIYQLQKRHGSVPPKAATLAACREREGLPPAPCHNALDDAMATLELLYAQLHELDPSGNLRLRDLRHTGALKMYGSRLS